jgi:hypothetical protein
VIARTVFRNVVVNAPTPVATLLFRRSSSRMVIGLGFIGRPRTRSTDATVHCSAVYPVMGFATNLRL